MILNFHHTALRFIAQNKSTFSGKGLHSVPIANVDDKRQTTATFCVNIVGNFLPVQVMISGFRKARITEAVSEANQLAQLCENPFAENFMVTNEKHF